MSDKLTLVGEKALRDIVAERDALRVENATLKEQAIDGSLRASYWWCEMDKANKELQERLDKAEVICNLIAEGALHNWLLSVRRYSTVLYDFLKNLDNKVMEWHKDRHENPS